METKNKETKFYSKTLMKQNLKSNGTLAVIVVIVMIMMSVVINFAMSMMRTKTTEEDVSEAQQEFYAYLYVMASYNEVAGTKLSYDDFVSTSDVSQYEAAFDLMNQKTDMKLSVGGLKDSAESLKQSEVSIDTYVHQFEYTYALGDVKGCFSGENLNVQDMMTTMLEVMGVSPDMVENMSNMDMTSMINRMYFTVMGILPILLFVVIVANSLLVDQVDSGSMAYVLSTPTKRSEVVNTQSVFLIVAPFLMIAFVCAARLISSFMLFDEVNVAETIVLYLGMYILIEAIAGICYLGSCLFNQSKKAMAFGGGLSVWFFLASLLGMFGSSNMVDMGVGVEALGIFNKLTLIGLYDIDSIATVGTESLDTAFIWKLVILAIIAVVCYIAGAVRFQKKDLPL